MVFPMLFIMRRSRFYRPLMNIGSVVLALVALAWATERIFDYDTQVNAFVDPILRWPRSIFVVAAGYVFATALWWFDRSRGALLPVHDTDRAVGMADEPENELVST